MTTPVLEREAARLIAADARSETQARAQREAKDVMAFVLDSHTTIQECHEYITAKLLWFAAGFAMEQVNKSHGFTATGERVAKEPVR